MGKNLKYFILNNTDGTTIFSTFDGLNEINRLIVDNDIIEVESDDEILNNNVIGKYKGLLAVGDGATEFKNLKKYITLENIGILLDEKVDKIEGKGLSTNDLTNNLLTKINNIVDGATNVSFVRDLDSGVKIGTININGVNTTLYSTDNTTYELVTESNDGLMSAEDKIKLNNIENNANNYSHPIQEGIIGVPTFNKVPNFGETFEVSQPVINTLGHVTLLNTRTIKIPDTIASSLSLGLIKIGTNINIDQNGFISVNDGSTSTKGLIQLEDSYMSESITKAATSNSVKSAYNSLNNIKVNISDIINDLESDNVDKPLSAAQGKILYEKIKELEKKLGYISKNQ